MLPLSNVTATGPRRLATVAVLLLLTGGAAIYRPAPTPTMQMINVGAGPHAVAVDARDGRFFVGDDGDASVSVFDTRGGRLLRTVRTGVDGSYASQSLAVDEQTRRLFVVNSGDDDTPSRVSVIDARSGRLLRAVLAGREAVAVAIDARAGRAFVASEFDATVSILDARSGDSLGTVAVGGTPVALAVDAQAGRAFVVSSGPAIDGFAASAGTVAVLDTRRGVLLHSTVVGWAPVALAVDERHGRVYVANSSDNSVSVLDAASGRLVGTIAVDWAPVALSVDERSGRVFVVNAIGGTVSVLDAQRGAVMRTVALGWDAHPDAVAVDARRGRAYVAVCGPDDRVGLPIGAGRVVVLDAVTGARLRSFAAGVLPAALAVDERDGRIIVANSGGAVRSRSEWWAPWADRLRRWLPWLRGLPRDAPTLTRAPGTLSVIDANAGG